MKRLLASSVYFLSYSAVLVSETATYQYDALGRLLLVTICKTSTGDKQITMGYDRAGNRMGNSVSSGGTPTPTNALSTAVADSILRRCNLVTTRNLVNNDSAPDGDLLLSIISVTMNAGDASIDLTSSTTVQVIGAPQPEVTTANYVLSDSRGAQSTGSIAVNTAGTGTQCKL